MSRQQAIDHATGHFESGAFLKTLNRRVGFRTESQESNRAELLLSYLTDEITPEAEELGFTTRIVANPVAEFGPFLIANRHEGDHLLTVLIYGHSDVVRGYDSQWRAPLTPWAVTIEGERWYGRGIADNKGQHSINLASLASVLSARDGKLGFNAKLLIEMGEETGSPGLDAICRAHREELAANVLIASDGPRLAARRPTVFLGSRGSVNFRLSLNLREGAHHSGNWGGLLRNPATVLANALASLVDARGVIAVDGLRPPPIPEAVRRALADITVGGGPGDPAVDENWGEPGLSAPERVFGWNSFEVLAMKAGNPENPVNAIPSSAFAVCQLRFVVSTDWENIAQHLRTHLDANGFSMIDIDVERGASATRLNPDDPWVKWAIASLEETTGKKTAVLPNLGGTLPNEVFADTLGLPTIWVPHSYSACSQHATNEHLFGPVVREGLQIMAGLFWNLGERSPHAGANRGKGDGDGQPRLILSTPLCPWPNRQPVTTLHARHVHDEHVHIANPRRAAVRRESASHHSRGVDRQCARMVRFRRLRLFRGDNREAVFPACAEAISLMLTLGTFGISYLIRPLGGFVLGSLADRAGRKAALLLSIALMMIGTLTIAVMPQYAAIGLWVPAGIMLSRLVQGFSAGGEFGASTAFLVEYAPERRGFMGSWQFASQGLATLLASGFGALLTGQLSAAQIESWGWRVPFLFGLAIGPVGFYIRRYVDEGTEFYAEPKARTLLRDLFVTQKLRMLLAVGSLVISRRPTT